MEREVTPEKALGQEEMMYSRNRKQASCQEDLNQNHNEMSFYSYESAYNQKADVIVVGKDEDKLEPSYTMIRM